MTAVCDHCGNGFKIRKDGSTSSFRKHLIRLHKNKVPELKGSNEPNTEPPQNVSVLDMLKNKAKNKKKKKKKVHTVYLLTKYEIEWISFKTR